MHGDVWMLLEGDEVLADLVVMDGDFPWLSARVAPAPGFGRVRVLFAEEIAALNRMDEAESGVEEWEAVQGRIRSRMRLMCPDGRNVPEFLLHIDGDKAWWRWNDEPFEE